MNASELAREVNLPVPTIHRLVTGKSTRPYSSSLKPIADYFSIKVEQLLGEEFIPEWDEDIYKLPSTDRIKIIPIISWDKMLNLDQSIQQAEKKVVTTGDISEKCFALIMNDYSMAPLFPKYTTLIFDPLEKPIDRSYVLVQLEGKTIPIFRQLLVDVDHKYLKPLNPDINTYYVRPLTDKDKIIGTLLESRINHKPDL